MEKCTLFQLVHVGCIDAQIWRGMSDARDTVYVMINTRSAFYALFISK